MKRVALGQWQASLQRSALAVLRSAALTSAVLVLLASPAGIVGSPLLAANASDGVVVKAAADANSPREDERRRLFEATLTKPSCRMIKATPRGQAAELDKDLVATVQSLLQGLRTKDEKVLGPLFHPRLRVGSAALADTFAKLTSTYGVPFDVTVYRLWALNTVSGAAAGLDCEDDHLKVFPQYGYPLQFGLWLQLMGQNEIGRIYVALVPLQQRWVIGAFKTQQWTHAAKDFAEWAAAAQKSAHNGLNEAAYVNYDTAAKLSDAGPFVELAVHDELLKLRDGAMLPAQWDAKVRGALKDFAVVYTGTIFVVGGDGISIRLRVPKELSLEDMTAQCKKAATSLLQQPWVKELTGVRCGFLTPAEDAKKDGAMGSLYMSFVDAIKPGKA